MNNVVQRFSVLAQQSFTLSIVSRFYGSANDLSLGVGLVVDGILFPLFDEEAQRFQTAQGLVMVLSHECDVDQSNERYFNDSILVCPIIKLESLVDNFQKQNKLTSLEGLFPEVGKNNVFRLQYLPPIENYLACGGYLYLNQITSVPVSSFRSCAANTICALSEEALRAVDFKLKNHLFRPKQQNLPRLN